MIYLLIAEFLILSSFLTVPVGLILSGYLFGAHPERDYQGRRELVNAYQGGERR